MTKTNLQRFRSNSTAAKRHARNLRKRRNQLLAGKQPRRTRAQRRWSVARYRDRKMLISGVVDKAFTNGAVSKEG